MNASGVDQYLESVRYLPRATNYSGQEKRRRLYEEWARVLCGQFVSVKFVDAMPEGISKTASGCAQWNGTQFEALLNLDYYSGDRSGCYEKRTAAHEIAHLMLMHPVKLHPSKITEARKQFAKLPQAERVAATKPIEDEADALAKKILRLWDQDPRINW